jgi:hypothetical protein
VEIKSLAHLDSVLVLMRESQKEAKRFLSKSNKANAQYWESIIDNYLEEKKNGKQSAGRGR